MTKNDLVKIVQAASNCPKSDAEDLVESVLDILKDTLASGEEVKISGFGKFVVHRKIDRTGRNPQTGEKMTITARKVLSFKPSNVLKEHINLN